MDYSSPYMDYEGYRGASRSSASDYSLQYPTQKAYDSVYSSFKDSFAGDMLSSGPGFSFGKDGRGGRGGQGGGRRGGGMWDKDEGSGSRSKGGRRGGGRRGGRGYDDIYGYDNTYDKDVSTTWKKSKQKENAEEFLCSMCDVQCNNIETFQTHMDGQRHALNLLRLEEGGELVKGSKKQRQIGEPNVALKSIDKVIAECSDPLIGLEYVSQGPNQNSDNNYLCEACNSRMNIGNIVAHLTGGRHRENYINKEPNHAQYALEIKQYTEELENEERAKQQERIARGIEDEGTDVWPRRSLINKKLHHFATIIEEQFGRQPTKISFDFIADARNQAVEQKKVSIPGVDGPKKKKLDKEGVEKLIYEGEDPMIGLDHVTEIVKEGDTREPNFQCEVCDTILNFGNLISHLKGVKHRHNYITMFHPELKEELKKQQKLMEAKEQENAEDGGPNKQKTCHERTVFLQEMALKVESMFGRKRMKKEFISNKNQGQSKRGGARSGGRSGGGRRGGPDGGSGMGHGGGVEWDVGRSGRRDGGQGSRHVGGRVGFGDSYDMYSGTDDYYGKPSKRRAMYDMHDEMDMGAFDYERPMADEGSGNLRGIHSRRDPYADDFQTRSHRTGSNLDDYYESDYSRRADMDMSSILSNPKQLDSDAYILAEFEKRFGKRIKLGGDSDTLVLGSNSNSGHGQRSLLSDHGGASSYGGGTTSYGGGTTSYGGGTTSYSGGTTSYGRDTGAYASSSAFLGSSSYGSSDRYRSPLKRTESSTTYNKPSYLGSRASGSLSYTGRRGDRDLGRVESSYMKDMFKY